jgi:hypothetical protein
VPADRITTSRRWYNGRIIAFQAIDPGSIPGRRTQNHKLFPRWISLTSPFSVDHSWLHTPNALEYYNHGIASPLTMWNVSNTVLQDENPTNKPVCIGCAIGCAIELPRIIAMGSQAQQTSTVLDDLECNIEHTTDSSTFELDERSAVKAQHVHVDVGRYWR